MLQSSEKSVKMSVKYDERSQPLFKICCIFSDLAVLTPILYRFAWFCILFNTTPNKKRNAKFKKSSLTGVVSSLLYGTCQKPSKFKYFSSLCEPWCQMVPRVKGKFFPILNKTMQNFPKMLSKTLPYVAGNRYLPCLSPLLHNNTF